MINLPKWRLTNKFPAFYDTESGSAIEQTAKVYGAMQELINEHNEFIVELTKQFNNFKGETGVEIDQFKTSVTELLENYIKTVDSKLTQQDLNISNIDKKIDEMPSKLVIEQVYNGESEAMDLIIKVGE